MTNEKGILFGFKALRHRFKTCRPGHEIIYLDKEDVLLIKLSNGTILQENEIASNIVAIYKSKAWPVETTTKKLSALTKL